MIINELSINENFEEDVPKVTDSFPHTVFYAEVDKFKDGIIPWHWHRDVEFSTLLQGNLRLSTNNAVYEMKAGDGIFINSNVMHFQETLPGPPVIQTCEVFRADLISGGYHSIFEQKYVEPILENEGLEAVLFRPTTPKHRQLLEALRTAQDAAELEEDGFEFVVRNNLSTAWMILYQEVEKTPERYRGKRHDPGGDRIKKMMLYIKDHYAEKIALEEIAAYAHISEREALRCFRNNLNTTPFSYLMNYRCRVAAKMLEEGHDDVTNIAYACGFASPSYFGKIFRREMGCSPTQYQKQKVSQGT